MSLALVPLAVWKPSSLSDFFTDGQFCPTSLFDDFAGGELTSDLCLGCGQSVLTSLVTQDMVDCGLVRLEQIVPTFLAQLPPFFVHFYLNLSSTEAFIAFIP